MQCNTRTGEGEKDGKEKDEEGEEGEPREEGETRRGRRRHLAPSPTAAACRASGPPLGPPAPG